MYKQGNNQAFRLLSTWSFTTFYVAAGILGYVEEVDIKKLATVRVCLPPLEVEIIV